MCCGSVADLQHNASVAAFIGLPSPPNIILCKKETKETNLKKNKATPNKGGRFQFGCDPSRAAGHPRSPAGGRYVENANSRARDAGGAALGRDPPTPSPGKPPPPGTPRAPVLPWPIQTGTHWDHGASEWLCSTLHPDSVPTQTLHGPFSSPGFLQLGCSLLKIITLRT